MWFTNVVHLYLEPIFAHINATDIDCWPFRQSGSRLAIISFIWPSDEWSAPVLVYTSPSPYVANNLAIIKRWTAAFYGGRYENSRFLQGQVTQRNSFGNHLAHLFFFNQRHHKTFNAVIVHWKLYLSQQGFSGTAKRVTCIATTKFMRGTNFSSFQFVSKLFPSIEIDSITDSMSITQFNMNTPFSLGYTSVRTRCTNGCKSVKNNTLWLNSLSG